MANINQDQKDDLKKIDKIDNKPLAFTVFFITTICTALVTTFVNQVFVSNEDRNNDCMEQVEYLRGELKSSNEELKKYVRTIVFKETQLREQGKAIDSLKRDIQ